MTNFILLTEEANNYIFSNTNVTILFSLGFGIGLYVMWFAIGIYRHCSSGWL